MHSELEELTGLLTRPRGDRRHVPDRPVRHPRGPGAFRASYPGVAIHMIEDTADALLGAAARGRAGPDLHRGDPDRLGDEFAATLLFQEEFVVAGAVGTPLLQRPARHARRAHRRGPHRLPRQLRAAAAPGGRARAARAGAAQRVRLHGDRPPCRALASKGLGRRGAAALGRRAESGPPIDFRPIGPEPLTWPVGAASGARPAGSPPAAKAFLALALERAAGRRATAPAALPASRRELAASGPLSAPERPWPAARRAGPSPPSRGAPRGSASRAGRRRSARPRGPARRRSPRRPRGRARARTS